ncbi:MAG TPA: glycosyltransferase family 4 protein [Blastocatellia bacterium]|nr:glycosyltransferase family 4 protein [Blastocatellia bacterium]
MRILVLTNFYPPHYVGGYELGCRDVVEGLRARGHEVRVLTSTYKVDKPSRRHGVYRWLQTDFTSNGNRSSFFRLLRKELTNRWAFKFACRSFMPDLVYAWNVTHISVSNLLMAQQMGLPVCYFVSDQWLSRWEDDLWILNTRRNPRSPHKKLAWRMLSSLLSASGLFPKGSLDLSHTQFVSRFLKQSALEAGKPAVSSEVIHWGIDVARFSTNGAARDPSKLLYVGQITAHKGVRTAVEALKLVRERYGCDKATLTVVGGPDYDNEIKRLVRSMGLVGSVRFTGLIPRERLPEIYKEHGTLIFPSVWDEPFSITLLEAMSSGLAVVSTTTGGSAELLADGVNALTFPKQDAESCALQVKRLIDDPELFDRIRQSGRQAVQHGFRLDAMIDKIEDSLTRVCDYEDRNLQ